jgi:hypothetical protein
MRSARIIRSVVASTLSILSIAGCRQLDGPSKDNVHQDEVEQVEQNFVFYSGLAFKSRIQNFPGGNTFRVCLNGTDVTPANRASKETMIRNAVITWVDAVRSVATTPLIGSADITFNTQASTDAGVGTRCVGTWDLQVSWLGQNGPAVTDPGLDTGVAWMILFNTNGLDTVLHELGHVFGLADTSAVGGGCKPGQPNSVMCGSGTTTLAPDDMEGIRAVFRSAFPGSITLPSQYAWLGSEVIQ